MKKRAKLLLAQICSFIVSIAPLIAVFIINRERYFVNVAAGVKLAVGGIIVVVMMLINALGRLKVPGGVMAYLVVFLLTYLLEAILSDLAILSGAALLGAVVDYLIMRPIVKKLREDIMVSKTADATADKVKQILDEYIGGRV